MIVFIKNGRENEESLRHRGQDHPQRICRTCHTSNDRVDDLAASHPSSAESDRTDTRTTEDLPDASEVTTRQRTECSILGDGVVTWLCGGHRRDPEKTLQFQRTRDKVYIGT